MNDVASSVLSQLDALLDEERSLLLTGDLDGLGALHDRKENLIERLARLESRSDPNLPDIQDKLRRNQALLDGAMAGIRSVARRLATARRVRQSLEFYGEDGERATVEMAAERSVEKRA